ncbi:MAG TPA: thioesterase [Deltaproteobacteria bacterium]|nr:thioesterase [Deltaproteobacteria bacterium]
MQWVDVPIRVRYADTDRMGIVYHGFYPMYFETGRTEFMREKGCEYRTFEDMGFHLVVTALEAKYHSTATYDDLLIVRTAVSEVKSRGVTFEYNVFHDGTLVVEGRTRHVCMNGEKRAIRLPPPLLDFLRNVESP